MPVTNYAPVKRITGMCGSELPADLAERLEQSQADNDAQFEIGVEVCDQAMPVTAGCERSRHPFLCPEPFQACERILDGLAYVPAA